MTSAILGVVLAPVVVYLWGFVYWGGMSLPYTVWNETADDVAAGQALREHFPESGVYYIPANSSTISPRYCLAGRSSPTS